MATSVTLERSVCEAGLFLGLIVATAAFHFQYSFQSPFLSSASKIAQSAQGHSSELTNFTSLLLLAASVYFVTRFALGTATTLIPANVKKSPWFNVAAVAMTVVVVTAMIGISFGFPPLGDNAFVQWMKRNWIRNGRNDLLWCVRLFVLLSVWQAIFSVGAVAIHSLAAATIRTLPSRNTDSADSSGIFSGTAAGGNRGMARDGNGSHQNYNGSNPQVPKSVAKSGDEVHQDGETGRVREHS